MTKNQSDSPRCLAIVPQQNALERLRKFYTDMTLQLLNRILLLRH